MSRMKNLVLSRFVALILLIILLLSLYLLLINPLFASYRDNQEKINVLQHELNNYQLVSSYKSDLEEQEQRLSGLQATQGYYLRNNTQALAAAELQAYVKKVIEDAGGRLLSTQPISNAASGSFHRIQVRVRMQGDIETLQQSFHALESGVPILILDDVILTQAKTGQRRSAAKLTDTLSVNFDLMGFMRVADK